MDKIIKVYSWKKRKPSFPLSEENMDLEFSFVEAGDSGQISFRKAGVVIRRRERETERLMRVSSPPLPHRSVTENTSRIFKRFELSLRRIY